MPEINKTNSSPFVAGPEIHNEFSRYEDRIFSRILMVILKVMHFRNQDYEFIRVNESLPDGKNGHYFTKKTELNTHLIHRITKELEKLDLASPSCLKADLAEKMFAKEGFDVQSFMHKYLYIAEELHTELLLGKYENFCKQLQIETDWKLFYNVINNNDSSDSEMMLGKKLTTWEKIKEKVYENMSLEEFLEKKDFESEFEETYSFDPRTETLIKCE